MSSDRSSQSRRQWVGTWVPLLPILVAMLIAFAAAQYGRLRGTPPPTMAMPVMSHAAPEMPSAPDIMDPAPDFTLPDVHGGDLHLAALEKQGPVLVIFYLGYNCPRCVAHLREIEEHIDEIRATGGQVVAISPDTPDNLKKSVDAFGDFPFPLLADPDLKAFRDYGLVFGKDALFHGCYIVDKEGAVAFAMRSSHPYDNVNGLVATLRGMK